MSGKRLFSLAATCLLLLSSISALGQERLNFGSALKTAAHMALPFLAAQEQGLWKQQGLEVEWVGFGGGTELYRAVAAGSVPLGFTMATDIIQTAARGIPIKIIADAGVRNDFYVWVPKGSRLKEPKELAGAKIGVPARGSVAHAYGQALDKELGLGGKMMIVGAGGIGSAIAGMKSGALDGVLLTHFAMAPLVYKGEIRGLISVREYLPKKWIDNAVLGRTDFMQKEPEKVKKAIKAFLLAGSFIVANRNWAVEKMKSFSGFSDEAAKGMYPFLAYNKDGRTDMEGLRNIVNFLVEYEIIPKDKALAPEQFFTNEFLS